MLLTLDGIAVSLVGHTVTMTDPLSAKTFLGWVKKRIATQHNGAIVFLKTYSSVPNRRVGRNKRAGGKILRKH
jgi:hypothetical protein